MIPLEWFYNVLISRNLNIEGTFSNRVNYLNELVDILIRWSEMKNDTQYKASNPIWIWRDIVLAARRKAKPLQFHSRCVSVWWHVSEKHLVIVLVETVLVGNSYIYPIMGNPTQFKYEGKKEIVWVQSKANAIWFALRVGVWPRAAAIAARLLRRQSFVLKAGGFFYPLVMPRVGRR